LCPFSSREGTEGSSIDQTGKFVSPEAKTHEQRDSLENEREREKKKRKEEEKKERKGKGIGSGSA